jgi:type I restriction enzyme S subunit
MGATRELGDEGAPTLHGNGWRRMKLKYVANLKSGEAITSDSIAPDGEYPVFGGNGLRGYTDAYTHEGLHVLIGRQGALCGNINYASGKFWASEHAVVATIRGDHHPRWLGELLRSMNLNQYSQAAAQPGLSVEFISNLEVVVPPQEVQRATADYLDAETARIDALIEAKEDLLAILAEKRRAVITQAVTRGLDPSVAMRDSGVPWLGEVPAHWEDVRIRFLVDGIEQGWSPQADSREPTEDEWGVLKLSAVSRGTFDPTSAKALPPELDPRIEYEVKVGDFLLTRANTPSLVGDACFVAATRPMLMLCDLIYRLRLRHDRIHGRYLAYFLTVPIGRTQIEADARGTSNSMVKISQEHIKSWRVPVPPVEEQVAIAEFLGREVDALDRMDQATLRTVQLLRERREAVIAAAVTGQLDVGAA